MHPRLCLLLLLIFSLPAVAEVYRWVDAGGVVHYTDKPHDKAAQPAALPPLQTYQPGAVHDPFAAQHAGKTTTSPTPPAPRITAPQSQATIRDAQRHVVVEVNAALQPDQGLIYYLDGQAQNDAPTQSTRYQLENVERGTHAISVALTDADGKPLSTSTPLTIYMKPPTAYHR